MLKEIIGKNKGEISINNHNYFYKRNDSYVEILIEKIADLFNLCHAHYEFITIEGIDYYLSEDLNNQGLFTTAKDAGLTSLNINDICDFIFEKFPNDYERLTNDVMRMFFMDLIVLNIDRSNDNWGFLIKDGVVNIYLLDNDLCFIYNNSLFTTLDDNPHKDSLLEIENILDSFPEEYINLFIAMFNTLDIKILKRLIKETERDINQNLPYKKDYLSRFDFQRWHIKKIIKQKKKTLTI